MKRTETGNPKTDNFPLSQRLQTETVTSSLCNNNVMHVFIQKHHPKLTEQGSRGALFTRQLRIFFDM